MSCESNPADSETLECVSFEDLRYNKGQYFYNECLFSGDARIIKNNQLLEIQFIEGKMDGDIKKYQNDVLIESGKNKNNLLNGEFRTFYLDGELNSSTLYKNGLKNGKSTYYWDNGQVGHIYYYRNDFLVDTGYSWNREGMKIARSIYLEGNANSDEVNLLGEELTDFISGSLKDGVSVGDWIYKLSSDSCFIRHYRPNSSYTQTSCDCDTLIIPQI